MLRIAPAIESLLALPVEARRIGPYRLVRQLGSGGFAPVWLAEEAYEGTTLRTAAVKLFAFDAGGSGAQRDAERAARHRKTIVEEARLLCQVEHPNIVRFYALAVDEERGVIGLAMEHVAGASLDRRLDALADPAAGAPGKLAAAETIVVGAAVASALAAIHAAGLVHRDIKPANVIEAKGVYKLIDFGIAAADEIVTREPKTTTTRVCLDDLPLEVIGTKMSRLADTVSIKSLAEGASVVGFTTGTLGYIDPECLATGARAVPESDMYALGVLLFECLIGKLPAAAACAGGLNGRVLDGRSPAPPIQTIEPSLPLELARLVDMLLSPERSRRRRSAEEVARELEEMMDDLGVVVSSRRPVSSGRGARRSRTSLADAAEPVAHTGRVALQPRSPGRRALALAGGAFLILAGGGIGSTALRRGQPVVSTDGGLMPSASAPAQGVDLASSTPVAAPPASAPPPATEAPATAPPPIPKPTIPRPARPLPSATATAQPSATAAAQPSATAAPTTRSTPPSDAPAPPATSRY